MKVYTDGATSNNGYAGAYGGWAYILVDNEDNIICKGMGYYLNATNNICELLAIINGCQAAEEIGGKHTIYSDSSYCINCYKEKWYKKWVQNGWLTSSNKPVANKKFWKQLIPYFENPNFSFEKVKGHATDESLHSYYNNYVDKMAVQAKELCVWKTKEI